MAKQEYEGNKCQMIYSLEFITEMFIQLAHTSPFITLQWCYILKLMKYTPQTMWRKVLQPEQRGLSEVKINSEQNRTITDVKPHKFESDSMNYELLRKGGLILLCDSLCENISNAVESTTWLIVNYTQCIVTSINESPVQEFVMSVHRSASSSGLLLQAVITRVGIIGDNAEAAFLKDALAVVENVHKQFAGKLVNFLVNKYLLGSHLSLTRHANFIACTRVEAMINTRKEDVLKLFGKDELASIMENLRLHKLTKRFGRLATLLNRVATDFFELSPVISTDDARTFNPGSISNVQLNQEWLLGQIRVRCCHPDNLTPKANLKTGQVCAQMLSNLNNFDEIMEIMNLKDFSLSILSSCLSYDSKDQKSLFQASKQVLLTHIKSLTKSLPRPFGLYRPNSWPMTTTDYRYCQWLDPVFNNVEFSKNLTYLMEAIKTALDKKAFDEVEAEDITALTRFCVLTIEYCKWINCDLLDEKVLQGKEETSCLCLQTASKILAHPKVSKYLSKNHGSGASTTKDNDDLWSTSMCLLINDIMFVRFEFSSNQVPTCPAFKVASEESQETPTMVASMKLNELLTDLTNKDSKARSLMPDCWYKPYKGLIIGLCRLDKFTSYMRIPPELWILGWSPMIDLDSLVFPSIPMDYLQDHDILEVYLKRLLLLGWRSRKQFEESWMALLGVFSLSKEDLSDAEVAALAQVSTLSVSAITGKLL